MRARVSIITVVAGCEAGICSFMQHLCRSLQTWTGVFETCEGIRVGLWGKGGDSEFRSQMWGKISGISQIKGRERLNPALVVRKHL